MCILLVDRARCSGREKGSAVPPAEDSGSSVDASQFIRWVWSTLAAPALEHGSKLGLYSE